MAPSKTHPSGYIAGIFARSDNERGVHKAPANEIVYGAIGLEYNVTDDDLHYSNGRIRLSG
jgi:hypothetical protein